MNEYEAMNIAAEGMCFYCPNWVRCKDDDRLYCDDFWERVDALETDK